MSGKHVNCLWNHALSHSLYRLRGEGGYKQLLIIVIYNTILNCILIDIGMGRFRESLRERNDDLWTSLFCIKCQNWGKHWKLLIDTFACMEMLLKFRIQRCNSLHAWCSDLFANLVSIGTTVSDKSACDRQINGPYSVVMEKMRGRTLNWHARIKGSAKDISKHWTPIPYLL